MHYLHTALRFSEWAIEFVTMPPLCFVLLLSGISLVCAWVSQQAFIADRWRPFHWLVVCHALFFAAAIAVGVFGANPNSKPALPHPPNPTAVFCLYVVVSSSIVSCGFWIWRMKGFRWFAASLMVLSQTMTCGAFVVADMAVSGDWL
jgi:hypothetical protein